MHKIQGHGGKKYKALLKFTQFNKNKINVSACMSGWVY